MPRCGHCGRVNPDEAVFCQDCGSRIEDDGSAGSGPTPAAGQGSPGGAERPCPGCGASNPVDMAFCRECGVRIADRVPDPTMPPSGPAPRGPAPAVGPQQPCPRCHEPNPPDFNFCQHCGTRLMDQAPAAAPFTPPSGLPVSTATPAASAQAATPAPRAMTPVRVGPRSVVPAPSPVLAGVPLASAPPLNTASGFRGGHNQETPAGWPDQAAGTIGRDRSVPTPVSGAIPAAGPGAVPAARAIARLIAVNRDGSDGVVFPVTGERFDIGRRTGTLLFEDDGYLSERHVRLERRQGRFVLVDLNSLNGVFVRIRQKEELYHGARILVGMELLRFELVPEHERDPSPAMEHGVLVFGTPPKLPWARLRQITTAGIARDIYHLYRAEVVVGREGGDIVFSDDDFMSRMHASIRNDGGKAWLLDMNSSNGTYLQVRGERILNAGDFIRLGDQLLRFEEP